MKKLLLILALMFVLVGPSVLAEFKCYTMVKLDSDVIQINPQQSEIQQVGIVDYFEPQPANSKYQYVKVYFTNEDLRDGKTVNFSVICAGENQTITFTKEITPTYKSAEETVEQASYLMDNVAFLFIGVVMLVLLLIVLGVIIKMVRDR